MANDEHTYRPDASAWHDDVVSPEQREAVEPSASAIETREVMSLDQFHQWMQRQWESRKQEGPRQPRAFGAYDAAEDVGSVRLLRLQAALKARRVSESEG